MVKHMRECIICFGEYISAPVFYPSTKNKFKVRGDTGELSDKKGSLLHSVVSKVLLNINSSRPYLETAVSFLTARVSKID